MASLTHNTNESYRKMGFKIGKGARIWGTIDQHFKCVSIGDYSTLGGGSFVATHCPINGISIERLKTNIEKDVWIGYGVSIVPGTTIERRCLIGMSSVVSGKLNKDSVYAGSPIRRIKIRNPIETVKTRLYTRQNITCIPTNYPKWDLTKEDVIDIFGDLLDNSLKMEDFDFLFSGAFCKLMLLENVSLPDNIEEAIKLLNKKFKDATK